MLPQRICPIEIFTWHLAQFHGTLFGFHPTVLSVFAFFFFLHFQLFDLSITEETWVVKVRIWCIKIVNVLVLHFNLALVEASTGELLVPEGLYSPVARYLGTCFEIQIWNELSREKVNFLNSSQNEGLSPSGIALSFNWFGSISWHSVWFSSNCYFSFHISFSRISNFFDLSITEENWVIEMRIWCIKIVNVSVLYTSIIASKLFNYKQRYSA
jgi:hypothetical protein